MRYVFRNEYFGGLLYDTVAKDYYRVDQLVAEVLRLGGIRFAALANKYLPEDLSLVQSELEEMGALSNTRFLNNNFPANFLSAPLRIFFDITYQCAEKCLHCFTNSGEKDPDELGLIEKLHLIDQMATMGTFRLSIAGGEPLTDDHFFPFVEYALDKSIDVSFSTSGTSVNRERAIKLSKLDIRTINVSIDGWDETSYAAVRGAGRFKYMLRGYSLLRQYYAGAIAAKCTITSTNAEHLLEIIAFAQKVGFDSVKFNCIRDAGRTDANRHLLPSREQYISAVKAVADYLKASTPNIRVVLPVNPFVKQEAEGTRMEDLGLGCYAGKESYCINPAGDITPCSSFGREQFVDGNVRSRTMQDAWINGEAIQKFRNPIKSDSCATCSLFSGCRGGCNLRAYKAFGSVESIDPYCYAFDPTLIVNPSKSALPRMSMMLATRP